MTETVGLSIQGSDLIDCKGALVIALVVMDEFTALGPDGMEVMPDEDKETAGPFLSVGRFALVGPTVLFLEADPFGAESALVKLCPPDVLLLTKQALVGAGNVSYVDGKIFCRML